MNIDEEQKSRLKEFEKLLLRWQKTVNLVSSSSESEIWNRHILDSYQLYPYIESCESVLDLGSGGGFPALVLAILDTNHRIKFYLAERDKRKAAFLLEASRQFSLNAIVFSEPVEQIKGFEVNAITSRALAEVEKILTLSQEFINNDTIFYLLKGKNADLELEKAKKKYDFIAEKYNSKTSSEGVILKISKVIKL